MDTEKYIEKMNELEEEERIGDLDSLVIAKDYEDWCFNQTFDDAILYPQILKSFKEAVKTIGCIQNFLTDNNFHMLRAMLDACKFDQAEKFVMDMLNETEV